MVSGAAITASETFVVTFTDAFGAVASTQIGTIQQNYTPAALPPGFSIPGAGSGNPTVGTAPATNSGGSISGTAAAATQPQGPSSPSESDVVRINATTVVDRFFNRLTGKHFFTGSSAEAKALQANSSNLVPEAAAFGAVDPQNVPSDPSAVSVYRFFDTQNGSQFLTASTSERDGLVATNASLVYEGVAFYEDGTQRAGDTAVYRFFDAPSGSHFLTASASEAASISATNPAMKAEGIAFYAPSLG